MAITTTTQLSNSLQQLLQAEYILAMEKAWIYGQSPIAWSPPNAIISASNRGSSLAIPIYRELLPVPTAISQTADVTPVALGDNVVTVSPDLYGNAVQLSQKLRLTATPDVAAAAAQIIARNAAETMDYVARTAAIGGSLVKFGGGAGGRSSSMATAAELTLSDWFLARNMLSAARCPTIDGKYVAVTRPAVVMDMIEDATLIYIGEYTRPEVFLNGEIGQSIAGVRVIESNFAKIFHGAGTTQAQSSAVMSTTTNAGSTSFAINSAITTDAVGYYVSVGTQESTANGEQAATETVLLNNATAATTLTFTGGGANGGLMYDHSSGTSIQGNFQVYATVFLGAESLLKCYTNDDGLGPNGVVLTPEESGLLKQFTSLGWKGFVGYARVSENRVFRVEHTSARYTIGK